MKMLLEDIKNKNFKSVYLLTGEEAYLRNQYKTRLRNALLDSEDTMNFSAFEGKNINPREVIDLAETMPFFADRRVLLIENSGFFKNSCQELADYISEIPKSACLIFSEDEVDKRGKLYKAVKSKGRVAEFDRQNEKTLSQWVLGKLKKEGKNITSETMQAFLERTGSDMERIDRELEKLLCYAIDRDVVTAADVEAICTEQAESRVFDMLEAVTEKNQRKALELYGDLLAAREPPMKILVLAARHFNQLLQLKSLSGQGLGKSELAKLVGLPPFAIGRAQAQCRRFTKEQLRQAVEDCVDADEKVKTGQMGDQLSVELLIMKYSGTGERG